MENLIDTIMSYEVGFYVLVALDLVYLLLKGGRVLFTSLASKTKTTKDDEIVAKIYEVLDKYKDMFTKASSRKEQKQERSQELKDGIWTAITYCFITILGFLCGVFRTKEKEQERINEKRTQLHKKIRKLSSNVDSSRTSRWLRD